MSEDVRKGWCVTHQDFCVWRNEKNDCVFEYIVGSKIPKMFSVRVRGRKDKPELDVYGYTQRTIRARLRDAQEMGAFE